MMNNLLKIKSLVVAIVILTFANSLKAQDVQKRYPFYVGAGIEKEFLSTLSAGFNVEGRFCGANSTQKLLMKPYVEFAPVKYFAIGAEYRIGYTHDGEEDESDWQGRLGLFAKGKYSFSGIKLEARLKYCNYSGDYDFWDTDDNVYKEGERENYFRVKLQAGYKIKPIKLTPYFSYELFDNLTSSKVDKLRYTFGLKKKIGKQNTIGFEYMLEQKFNRYSKKGNRKDDINNNIFAISYKYTLPYKSKTSD